jgi:hypothetical protein
MTIGDSILSILDDVLWEDCGQMRFEALYLGEELLDESELF